MIFNFVLSASGSSKSVSVPVPVYSLLTYIAPPLCAVLFVKYTCVFDVVALKSIVVRDRYIAPPFFSLVVAKMNCRVISKNNCLKVCINTTSC